MDYVKIDTEGFDLKVIQGALGLLSRTRFLQFEYNAHWLFAGSSLYQAFSILRDQGFEVYLIRNTGLHPLQYEVWGDYFRYSNYFACRAPDSAHIQPLIREAI
jgi:hypothetical protein